jgi:hypothetical protein
MLTVLACIFVPLGVIWLLVVSPSFRTAAVIFVALILHNYRRQDSYGEPAQQTNQVIEDNNRHQKETATVDEWCRANVAGVDIKTGNLLSFRTQLTPSTRSYVMSRVVG